MSLLTGPYALFIKWGAIVLLVAAVFGYGWIKGNAHGTAKLDAYIFAQMQEETRIAGVRTVVTQRVVTKYLEKAGATETIVKEVEKEVTRYAKTNPDGLCIDAEWTRLHNAAATGVISTSGLQLDSPLRAPFLDPEGIRFPYRVPGAPSRYGELREASSLRGSAGFVAGLGY